jgi:hypothetical protein
MQTLWVLQIRESGEEDQVYLFTSEQSAEQRAYDLLHDMAKWQGEEELPDSLEELEELCSDFGYGYYQIYEQEVE